MFNYKIFVLILLCSFFNINESHSDVLMQIEIKKGKNFYSNYNNNNFEPQIAIWAEDKNGNFINTICVTPRDESLKKYIKNPNSFLPLPIWMKKQNIRQKEHSGFKPQLINLNKKEANSIFINWNIPPDLADKTLIVFVEVNALFDFNKFYRDNSLINDINGQPSLILSGTVHISKSFKETKLITRGIGLKRGNIESNLKNMTTALNIIESIKLKLINK